MLRPDFDRIGELVKKLDDLCREAAEIRDAIAHPVSRPEWPVHRSVSPVVRKSIISADIFPTSTVERAN
jgi:hypothetical protein